MEENMKKKFGEWGKERKAEGEKKAKGEKTKEQKRKVERYQKSWKKAKQ